MSLDVDGNFTPCRHLIFAEKFETIGEYCNQSEILNEIRNIEDSTDQPCDSCELGKYCLSCLTANYEINGKLVKRSPTCSIAAILCGGDFYSTTKKEGQADTITEQLRGCK